MVQIIKKQTTREEYDKIAKEIRSRFKYCKIRRNNQQYAMGGFNLFPKDYEKGFTSKQIDSLCIFLKCLGYDDDALSVRSNEVYGEGQGEFTGTKIKYLILKDNFSFLNKIEVIE